MDIIYAEISENKISITYKSLHKSVIAASNITLDGYILSYDIIASEIKLFITENKIIKKYICFTVKSSKIITRYVSVNLTRSKEIANNLTLTAKRFFSIDFENYIYDYEILCRQNNCSHIMLGVIPLDLASDYIKIAAMLKLNIHKIQFELSYSALPSSIFLMTNDKCTELSVFSERLRYSKFLYSPTYENISDEIKRIVLHFNTSFADASVINCVVCGGNSSAINEHKHIADLPLIFSDEYETKNYFDFTPKHYKNMQKVNIALKRRIIVLVATVFVAVFFYAIAANSLNKKNIELNDISYLIQGYNYYETAIEHNIELRQEQQSSILNELTYGVAGKTELLEILSSALPDKAFIRDIKIGSDFIADITAVAYSRENALVFAKNVGNLDIVKEVTINYLSIDDRQTVIMITVSITEGS